MSASLGVLMAWWWKGPAGVRRGLCVSVGEGLVGMFARQVGAEGRVIGGAGYSAVTSVMAERTAPTSTMAFWVV